MFRRYEVGNHSKGTIVPRSEVMEELNYDQNYISFCLNKMNTRLDAQYRYETVPCQKCFACQLNYSANWATRIMLECQKNDHNYFLTLTYDDEHLPVQDYLVDKEGITWSNPEDGSWNGTLVEEDMTRFINSLRKYFERKGYKGIKYFYAGEYGDQTFRPHYHVILMNCPLDIRQFYDTYIDKNFKTHWKSCELKRFWDKGIIDIAEVEWSSAAYVARYCTKKISFETDKSIYYSQGKIPEYIRMSNGIGFDYFEEHKNEMYQTDELIMRTVKGNIGSSKPPKAFDKRLKEENPELFKLIQKSRHHEAERRRKYLEKLTDYTDKQKLLIDAEKALTKQSLLPRPGEWEE